MQSEYVNEYLSNKDNLAEFIENHSTDHLFQVNYIKDELLSIAASFGDISQIDQLIELGARYTFDEPKNRGGSGHFGGVPLFHAIKNNRIEAVKHLLTKYPKLIHTNCRMGYISYDGALIESIYTGNCKMVETILDFGVDINYYSRDNDTHQLPALHVAVIEYRHMNIDIVKLLLKRGANRDLISCFDDFDNDVYSNTWFSQVSSEKIAKYLLNQGFIPTQNDIQLVIQGRKYHDRQKKFGNKLSY